MRADARTAHPPPLRLSMAAFAMLIAMLLWAPIPLGSNRPWSLALLATAILAVTALVLVGNLDRTAAVTRRVGRRWPCLALLALWAGTGAVQLVPLPRPLLALLAPSSLAHWGVLAPSGAVPISVDPGTTAMATLEALAYVALLALVLLVVDSWRRLMLLALVIVGAGLAQALAGIGIELATGGGLLARGPVEGVGGASGTFVNPNHFAGFIEMALALSLGLSLLRPRWDRSRASPRSAAALVDFAMSSRALLLLAQTIMLGALLWSGSRGALLAIVVAAASGVALSLTQRRPTGAAGTAAMLLIAVLAAIAWWGPGALGDKLATQGLGSNRAAVFSAAFDAARDQPLLGSGAGTFRHVFPAYKTAALDMRHYEHAHNDFLEELVERGVLGLLFAGSAVVLALAHIVSRLRARHGRRARALLAGALIGTLALLVHGLYDFNLQIPANAAYFVTLIGIGLVAADLERKPGLRMPMRAS